MQHQRAAVVLGIVLAVAIGAACSAPDETVGSSPPTSADTTVVTAPAATTPAASTPPSTTPAATTPAATTAVTAPVTAPTSGRYTIDVDGTGREYLLHVPDGLEPGAALVLVLHGYTDTASNVSAYTGFDAVADAEGFVVAYPQGTVDDLGATFFDVGYAFHDRRVDDVGFLRTLAADLVGRLDLDPGSVFVTGMSNGGDMAYLLACADQPWIAALAPVAGMMLEAIVDDCTPADRTPIMEIHGTADEVTFWDGDPDNIGAWGAYLSQMEAMRFWAGEYGLEEVVEVPVPELSEAWSLPVTYTRWSTAADDTDVILVRIDGGAHVWPGIEASVAIWDFFESHRPD